jgi:hypothetical protein
VVERVRAAVPKKLHVEVEIVSFDDEVVLSEPADAKPEPASVLRPEVLDDRRRRSLVPAVVGRANTETTPHAASVSTAKPLIAAAPLSITPRSR